MHDNCNFFFTLNYFSNFFDLASIRSILNHLLLIHATQSLLTAMISWSFSCNTFLYLLIIFSKSFFLKPRDTLLFTDKTSVELSDFRKPWLTKSRKILRNVYLDISAVFAPVCNCFCHHLYFWNTASKLKMLACLQTKYAKMSTSTLDLGSYLMMTPGSPWSYNSSCNLPNAWLDFYS